MAKKKAIKKLVRSHGDEEEEIKLQGSLHVCTRSQGSKEKEIKLQGSLHVCTRSQGSKEKEIKLQGSLHVCPMLSCYRAVFYWHA